MSVLDLAEAILKQYPDLSYSVEGGSITVAPPTNDGFSVSLSLDEPEGEFVVSFDVWALGMENECAALNCFVWGLTDRCRLKVEKRGDKASVWVAEFKDGIEWNGLGRRIYAMFVPFWRKKSVEYRQNSMIEDTQGFGPSFDPEEGATAVIKLLENAGVQYSPKISLEEEFHLVFADGGRYEGDWKDGKRTGRGVVVAASGDRYEGDWKYGMRRLIALLLRKWLRRRAEQGHADAQNILGEIYLNGQGVPQDNDEAVKWFRKAAEQGFAPALFNLGTMYDKSLGVPRDNVEAVQWYHKAADQGFAPAQHRLGVMYTKGKGVAHDYVEAVKWFRKAADQGDASAQSYLGMMYRQGAGLAQDDAEAVKWWRKAADQDHPEGQYNLGVLYAEGRGVPQDNAEAVKWYRRAAEQNDAMAQHNLGHAYRTGKGVPQDTAEAVKWLRTAAEQGHDGAQSDLGVIYGKGRGVPQDYVLAHMWFSLAAAHGNEKAVQNRDLAEKRMTPVEMLKAERLAREWLEKHPR